MDFWYNSGYRQMTLKQWGYPELSRGGGRGKREAQGWALRSREHGSWRDVAEGRGSRRERMWHPVAGAELCRGPWTRNADGLPGVEGSPTDNQEETGTSYLQPPRNGFCQTPQRAWDQNPSPEHPGRSAAGAPLDGIRVRPPSACRPTEPGDGKGCIFKPLDLWSFDWQQ